MNILKRGWMPLSVVVVVAIGGFTVDRVRGVFGSDKETTRAGAGQSAPAHTNHAVLRILTAGDGLHLPQALARLRIGCSVTASRHVQSIGSRPGTGLVGWGRD
jgi:hypothetical protein